jgi:diketogulonate reductase-like aldo/keto reductase
MKRNPVLESEVVQDLAKKHERSIAEVVLSWAMARNMSVIPRSSKPQHIRELARLLDPTQRFFLSESDLALIDGLEGTAD